MMNKATYIVNYPEFYMTGKSEWKTLTNKAKAYSSEQSALREIKAEIKFRETQILDSAKILNFLNSGENPEKMVPAINCGGPKEAQEAIKELKKENKEFIKLYNKDISLLKNLKVKTGAVK